LYAYRHFSKGFHHTVVLFVGAKLCILFLITNGLAENMLSVRNIPFRPNVSGADLCRRKDLSVEVTSPYAEEALKKIVVPLRHYSLLLQALLWIK
jgi:hypothetical protein